MRALNDDESAEIQFKASHESQKPKANEPSERPRTGVLTALRSFFDKLYIDNRAVDSDSSQVSSSSLPSFIQLLFNLFLEDYWREKSSAYEGVLPYLTHNLTISQPRSSSVSSGSHHLTKSHPINPNTIHHSPSVSHSTHSSLSSSPSSTYSHTQHLSTSPHTKYSSNFFKPSFDAAVWISDSVDFTHVLG